jgi:hypothetical protein
MASAPHHPNEETDFVDFILSDEECQGEELDAGIEDQVLSAC